MKKCKQGYYYCYKDKKCKRIPGGYRIGLGGYLRREKGEEKSEDSGETETKKNGNGGNGNGENGNGGNDGGSVSESKSGDSSLRDWFSKSKSSDGKPGWVQLGGKYAGKPCAKQPGQKTKPKCGSSKMAANLDDKEEKKAFNRKQRQDPNPNRKGKAINVKTESYSNWRQNLQEKPGDEYLGLKNSYEPEGEVLEGMNAIRADAGPPKTTMRMSASGQEPSGDKLLRKASQGFSNFMNKLNPKAMQSKPAGPQRKPLISTPKEEVELTGELVDEGKKDACYHKVKSRYSVWPSAYASGALVKCRKVGAKNWGNKTKNESVDYSNWRDDFVPTNYETIDLIKADPIQVPPSNLQKIEEKCWAGYEKKGMKTMFGKRYPNCVKKKKTKNEHYDWRAELDEGSAWTKKEGKNEKGGLNEKGRKSYEKENPGSNLKRPSKKVGNKRRASFCARMKGMKKKLTSKKTANDPNSRINKSLRAWNC